MDPESLRAFLLTLPHVAETVQWGDNLVFWVADKSIGGKMFAVVGLSPDRGRVLSFAAGPERFAELIERERIFPAPYLARAHWVALERWDALSATELKSLLHDARNLVYAKLPARTRARLDSAAPKGKPARKRSLSARKRVP